jgi:hypothetical protein
VKVYDAEKTLADCFKYRNKIGMDTVLEALTLYRDQKKPKPGVPGPESLRKVVHQIDAFPGPLLKRIDHHQQGPLGS